MTKQTDDEIAALKARVEELERAAKPPEPFVPTPHQQYDPTANMSMPRSALQAMVAAVPDHMLRDIVRDHRGAPTGPSPMSPSSSSQGGGPANVAGSGTGWAREIPLGPPPGIRYVDQQLDHADAVDKADRIRQDAQLKAMEKMAEQTESLNKQTEALSKLVEEPKP
jgi:hypothetical protein